MSKKKNKTIRLSKKQIAVARETNDRSIIDPLLKRYMAHDPDMSMAEKHAASSMIAATRPADSIVFLSPSNFLNGHEKVFSDLFLAYFQDWNGERGIFKYSKDLIFRDRLVPIEEKREDVTRLGEYFAEWEPKFSKTNHKGDPLLNTIVSEINETDLKSLEADFLSGKLAREDYDYKRRGTIHRAHYIYNKVKMAFEEQNGKNIEISYAGKVIEITPWTMVHVLNRHYAGGARQLDNQKSAHGDPELRFFEEPEVLKSILEEIGSHPSMQKNSVRFIPFKFNGVIYSIHTENQKKDNGTPYIRIQTFYPAEEKKDLYRIENEYIEVVLRPELSGYRVI